MSRTRHVLGGIRRRTIPSGNVSVAKRPRRPFLGAESALSGASEKGWLCPAPCTVYALARGRNPARRGRLLWNCKLLRGFRQKRYRTTLFILPVGLKARQNEECGQTSQSAGGQLGMRKSVLEQLTSQADSKPD